MIRALGMMVLALAASNAATAAEDSNAAAADSRLSVPIDKHQKFGDAHDLTDAKMKANDGSLSRFSLKANLTYEGPGIGDFSQRNRPNPDGSVGNYAQNISGKVMARYRLDQRQALNLGAGGVTLNHPFHGVSRTAVAEPFIGYDVSAKYGEFETQHSATAIKTTTPEYADSGEVGGLMYDGSISRKIGSSRFSLSFESELAYWAYGRGYRESDGLADQWYVMATPILRYNASDRFNMYASSTFTWANPRSEDFSSIKPRTPKLAAGFGYGIGRDIYVSPYVQSYSSNVSPEATTFNVMTIFSLL